MLITTQDAKARLEAEGLRVARSGTHSLLIAASVREVGGGVQVLEDASALMWRNSGSWIALFPTEGLFTYEVPGTLPDLVSLILAVYARLREAGGSLNDAFRQVVSNPDQYLDGRPPAHV